MAWVDWAILIVMAASVLGGFIQGFLRSIFSLGGLFFGLLLAAWNYERGAALLLPFVHFEAAANTLGFLLIAVVVMTLANVVGWVLYKTAHGAGLGCLDRLIGAGFGLLQGGLVVTLVILLVAAFFPHAEWLSAGRLPRLFFGICHLSTHVSPGDLAARIREGLLILEERAPGWLHPGIGGV